MKEDKIYVLSRFISALVLLTVTIIFDEIAIGLVLAIICYPISKYLAKQFYQKRVR